MARLHRFLPALFAGLVAIAPAFAVEDEQMSSDYREKLGELKELLASRDTEVYELDFKLLELDRILLKDRLGQEHVYHYLTFRLRNRVSADAEYLAKHATRYNEVLASIVKEYESARTETEYGAKLYVDDVSAIEEPEMATIVEREDLRVRTRKVNVSAIAFDENGTRFRLLDEEPGHGPQEAFGFPDRGLTDTSTFYNRVREAVEERAGRRLLTVSEIRARELAPYDPQRKDEEGVAEGEVFGILIFDRFSPHSDRVTVEIYGLSNKLRIQAPEAEPGELEDYFNTRVLRRTYVAVYRRAGDEYFRDLDDFAQISEGWQWQRSFQRLDHRRTAAYAKYFLDNIADDSGAPDEAVESEFWEHYNALRQEKDGLPDIQAELEAR